MGPESSSRVAIKPGCWELSWTRLDVVWAVMQVYKMLLHKEVTRT